MDSNCKSFEQLHYEQDNIWSPENIMQPDLVRVQTLAGRIPPEVHTVLDVGCGNGMFLHQLAKGPRTFSRLCGIDRSLAAMRYVQTEKYSCSIDAMPFKNREFDLVASTEVIEHLPQDIYLKGLNEIARIAKKYIIISVPNNEKLERSLVKCPLCCTRFNPSLHVRSFNSATIVGLFDSLGYTCNDVFGIYGSPACKWRDAFLGLRQKKRDPSTVRTACPMCGYKAGSKNLYQSVCITEKRKSLYKECLSYFWPKEILYRWIGAVFTRK